MAGLYEVWEADFDKNGESDLAIQTATGGCGYACGTRVMFVMFDSNRVPHLFQGFSTGLGTKKPGDKQANDENKFTPGFQDICRAPNGDCILILQSLEHGKKDASYWRTTAWKASKVDWTEVHNIGSAHLPSYVRFTHRDNNRPTPGMDYLGKHAASNLERIDYGEEVGEHESMTIK